MSILEKINKMHNIGWWDYIDRRQISLWIENFGDNHHLGEVLVNSILFYTENQINAIVNHLEDRLDNEIYIDQIIKGKILTDTELNILSADIRNQSRILPAAFADDPASSAMLTSRVWRDILRNKIEISNIENLENDYLNGISRFIFVNDFVGTGSEISTFLSSKIRFKGEVIRICEIPNKYGISFFLCLYMLHEQGASVLSSQYSQIKVIAAERINNRYNLLDKDCAFLSALNQDEKCTTIASFREIIERCRPSCEYNLGIPLIYHYGCPNNTFPLYWMTDGGWNRFYKLGGGRP